MATLKCVVIVRPACRRGTSMVMCAVVIAIVAMTTSMTNNRSQE